MRTSLPARRALIAVLALAPIAGCSTSDDSSGSSTDAPTAPQGSQAPEAAQSSPPDASPEAQESDLDALFSELENEFDARLGVYAVDTGTESTVAFREDERFAYASTHKVLSAAVVLDQNSIDDLEETVTYSSDELAAHSPITEQHVDTGMTLRELCDAALRFSDNTAANLLLEEVGGPDGLERALEELGDDVTSVDRYEPELNEAAPGDIRDTSTPDALATDLLKYALGDVLPAEQQGMLNDWLRGNTTGDTLIRAGVPAGWDVGDRSGAGGYGTRNNIAVIWPPDEEPIVMAVLSSKDEEDAEHDDALIAEAAEIALDALR
ncbi:class A beta-lactamase [Phytoactinopolyspora endophytica]|uniref:class A beta-lactamase n=1 Tax=Phytoactinopolyspora endophytica TaxID=1642495 RepID=UPI00101B850E|nr:class A beta-lactamase [Phytoactinopolyspora endophytica]